MAWLPLAFAAALAAEAGRPADAAEALLAALPAETAAVAVLQDGATALRRVLASPAGAGVKPLWEAWRNTDDGKKLDGLDALLKAGTGSGFFEHAENTLGLAVAAAYVAGPEGDYGLLALQARDEALLKKLFEGVIVPGADRKTHGGAPYYSSRGGKPAFWRRDGARLLLSDREAGLKAAMDAPAGSAGAAARKPLLDAWKLTPPDATLRLAVAPRRFDAKLPTPQGDAGTQWLGGQALALWHATRAAGAWLRIAEHTELAVAAEIDHAALPSAWRTPGPPANSGPTPVEGLPGGLAFARLGLNAPAVVALLRALPLESKDTEPLRLAEALFPDRTPAAVGAQLGPRVAAALLPLGGRPEAVLALEFREDQKAEAAFTLAESFEQAARLLGLAATLDGERGTTASAARHAGVRLHTLSNVKKLPPAVRPTFAVHEGWMLLGTSPAAVQAALDHRSAGPATDDMLRVEGTLLQAWAKEPGFARNAPPAVRDALRTALGQLGHATLRHERADAVHRVVLRAFPPSR